MKGPHPDPRVVAERERHVLPLGAGCLVLRSPEVRLGTLRALKLAERTSQHQDGRPLAPHMTHFMRALELAVAQDKLPSSIADLGSAAMPSEPSLPTSNLTRDDLIDVSEAAVILDLKHRQVRNLAEQLEGRQVGRQWWFERQVVTAAAVQRRRARP